MSTGKIGSGYGLYNMLGMGKRHLGILLFWENVMLFVISMVGGLLGGILLSKLAELCLIMVLNGEVNYDLTINMEAFKDTWIIFAPIFAVIFLKSLIQLRRLSAVALMKSENVGEKPPKANYLFGIAGVLILAAAYYIALSIESPLLAMAWFFVAVCLVIVGTYLLFISGSVMLCKILQNNKTYYYNKKHFVSVSSMAYRMKRNGAGLASICILSTMVLVMMMGAGSLYFGREDSINTRYPYDIAVYADYLTGSEDKQYTEQKETLFYEQIDGVLKEHGVEPANVQKMISTSATGMLADGKLILDPNTVNAANTETMNNVAVIYLIPLESYNQCMGAQETLDCKVQDCPVVIPCTHHEDEIKRCVEYLQNLILSHFPGEYVPICVIPYDSTDAWIVAAFDDLEDSESIADPWNSIISRRKEYHGIRVPGHKKTKAVYDKLIPVVCKNWETVKNRCSQAAYFDRVISEFH